MSVLGKTLMVGLIAGSAGFAGIWAGDQGLAPADIPAWVRGSATWLFGTDAEAMVSNSLETSLMAAPEGAVIYYRHLDQAAYSSRAFRPYFESLGIHGFGFL